MSRPNQNDTIIAGFSNVSITVKDKNESSPSARPVRALKKMPSIQRVDTYLNQAFTVTPASAHSTIPSASSVMGSPAYSSLSSPSYQTQPQSSSPSVDHFALPEPAIPSSVPTAAPYSPSYSRQNGLTRKISSGKRALSRLGRTSSSGAASRRDPSSGPVARRRSDSKTSTIATYGSEEPLPEIPSIGLALLNCLGTEEASAPPDIAHRIEQRAEIVAPSVPGALIGGCMLTKITKRKWQDKMFSLDSHGSAVSWMGTLKVKQFYIDDIKSIRRGMDPASSLAVAAGPEFDTSRYFTVNYAPSQSSKDTKTLHLLAPTEHICSLWVNTLEALAKHREELMLEMSGSERESVLRAYWESELNKQNHGSANMTYGLDRNTVIALCRKLHIHCPKSVIEEGFGAADPRGTGLLDFTQFRSFVRRLKLRLDIKPLYNSLRPLAADGTAIDGIGREDFMNFLQNEQGVNVEANRSYWMEKYDALTASTEPLVQDNQGVSYMGFAAFTSFILSPDCHIHAPSDRTKIKLDRPLNEYFISSSHNTYLMGRQVNGTSSVEPYVTALRKGCRSVEIDCWDGENNNPRVTHGYTGTTSISFSEVIHAINRCAFEASPYPVILSLEVHCNPVQQLRMVEILKNGFEPGRLLEYPLVDDQHILPSPESLKYKILVKVKATNAHPTPNSLGEALTATRKRSTSSPVRKAAPGPHILQSLPSYGMGSPLLGSPPDSLASPTDLSMAPTSEEDPESDANNSTKPPSSINSSTRKTSKITSDLANLGVYMQGYSYRSSMDLTFRSYNHIFSINEHTAMSVSKSQDTKTLFEKHNASYMCRVYPKNTRLNSSNFDPNTFWRRGVQMVALNWQTYDIHMQMNQAMFAAGTDRTGYVLKPDYLRDPSRFDGRAESKTKLPHQKVSFRIKVISAQQLPLLSTMDKNQLISPYVQVQMFSAEDVAKSIATGQGGEGGSRADGLYGIGKPLFRQTKTVPENGFNPQFNDVLDLSIETKYPELVFVRFAVYQSGKNQELATFTSKLSSLQKGYRHLPLYNNHGEELIFSSLYCHISKADPKPSPYQGKPTRQGSIRKLLSRSNTSERGRKPVERVIDSDRVAVQLRLNREIEAKKR